MAIIQQYNKASNTTYVYESESYWVPELGQSRSKRKLLGKLDPATGEIVPCGKRGPKKKESKDNGEQIPASEHTKLREQYEQLQAETTALRLSLNEMEKEVSDLRKQNQRMKNIIQKVRGLIAE